MTTLKTALEDPATSKAETLVVGVAKGPKGLVLAGGTVGVDAALGGTLAATLTSLGACGNAGEITKVPTMGQLLATTVLAVGLGASDKGPFAHEVIRRAAGAATRALAGSKRAATTLALVNSADGNSADGNAPEAAAPESDIAAVAEGVLMGGYRFGAYRTGKDAAKQPVVSVTLLGVPKKSAAAARAAVIAESVGIVRDLVNTAPRDLPPAVFADKAAALATAAGLGVEVLDEKALAAGAYGGILGVGQGSIRPPRLVRIEHKPAGATTTVAIIGKGITFDSGGLSLKPPASMETMKSDMAGAAATLGTVLAAAKLKLGVHVVGYLPMAENMPSGTAIRPSDILTMYGGKTVEVLNTDAEGRLVLADALVRCGADKPALIMDIATLTGAQVVALGNRVSGVMGTDLGRERVVTAAAQSGEQMWPMPLPDEIRPSIDSEIADLQNIGDRAGGMLTAGLFLKEFVPPGAEWAHIDIAGPSYNTGGAHGYTPKGGTGVGVRTMLTVLENIAANGG